MKKKWLMMLDSITAESIFAEIMMDEAYSNAYLLVEGPDENAIFFGHVSAGIELIVCGGKKNVLGAARIAESAGQGNVYGLVDSDFDQLRGIKADYPAHVVGTSGYDLISDLVLAVPGALRRSLSAHAAPGVSSIEREINTTIDDAVFALTSRVAGARLAAIREGYPLIFKGYNFSRVVDTSYNPLDLECFLEHAIWKDADFTIDVEVVETLEQAFLEVGSGRTTSGGHDIVGASVALLRQAGFQVSTKTLAGTLISTASCGVLESLSCLKTLVEYASRDSGTHLLDCFGAPAA